MDIEYKKILLKLARTGAIRALVPLVIYLLLDGTFAECTWWRGMECCLMGIAGYYFYRAAKRARLQLANVIWMLLFCVGAYITGLRWLPIVGVLVFQALTELEWQEKLRPIALSVLLPCICGWWGAMICFLGYVPLHRYLATGCRWDGIVSIFFVIATFTAIAVFRIKRIMILLVMALAGWLLF